MGNEDKLNPLDHPNQVNKEQMTHERTTNFLYLNNLLDKSAKYDSNYFDLFVCRDKTFRSFQSYFLFTYY